MAETINRIIVIGTSAGGVEALTRLVSDLPEDMSAAVFIVLHIPANSSGVLPKLLGRTARMPVSHPLDGDPIQAGHIYVAPPDHHLLLRSGTIHVSSGPKENSHRPAIDPLFRTAARNYGARVIGVILTGNLDDGSAGLLMIKRHGGLAVVQSPTDAQFPSMPASAIDSVDVDYVQPLSQIGPLLQSLANAPAPVPSDVSPDTELDRTREDDRIAFDSEADSDAHAAARDYEVGRPSVYACPDCHGVLWEIQEGDVLRYRCRVGHAYTVENLLSAQEHSLEDALWAALRSLEETSSLAWRMELRAAERGHAHGRKYFRERAIAADARALVIRQAIERKLIAEPGAPNDDIPYAEK
ncbi:protein-glutamate methylesterase [Capsulimonas corticalis]|uniref:protein-glutamate methylesterase n=1 Tax=Capsulimonas corticalis TaxID=2219043 RepID=A0A402D218_9BACT|nr:chemotaxis protein CheB [Capsulimonas corticalis]BDI30144.1 protein-glutamate methylesterase [Capsulimonas corticalis]